MTRQPPENRHTRQRRLILSVVKLSVPALTAEEVFQAVRRQLRGVSVSTVYRNLDLLASRGEIVRSVGPDGTSRFAGTVQPQVFFTCTRCERTRALAVASSVPFFQKHFPRLRVMTVTAYLQGFCTGCMRPRRHRA